MLHGTRSRRRFLALHIVAMLEQCCNHSKQCRNNVATQCWSKHRRCESSRVTSPLERAKMAAKIDPACEQAVRLEE